MVDSSFQSSVNEDEIYPTLLQEGGLLPGGRRPRKDNMMGPGGTGGGGGSGGGGGDDDDDTEYTHLLSSSGGRRKIATDGKKGNTAIQEGDYYSLSSSLDGSVVARLGHSKAGDGGSGRTFESVIASLCSFSTIVLLFWGLVLILSSTGQQLAFKLIGYSLGPFPFFILFSISWSFVPLFFGAVFFIKMFRPDSITPEAYAFPKRRLFVIGFFNAMNGVFVIFSNPHVPGTLQAILAQSVIPIVMIMSFFMLRTRYRAGQYVAALIIFGGIFTDLYPTLFPPAPAAAAAGSGAASDAMGGSMAMSVMGSSGSSGASGRSSANSASALWNICFFLGSIPAAAQSVYQEKAFSESKINVIYLSAWSSLGQAIVLTFCAPLNFIPGFGNIPPKELIDSFGDALSCVGGTTPASYPTLDCGNAGMLWAVCILSMLIANVASAGLTKYGSATFYVLVSTMITPASEFAFTFKWLIGQYAESMSIYSWIALILLVAGILLYYSLEKPKTELVDVKIHHDGDDGDETATVTVRTYTPITSGRGYGVSTFTPAPEVDVDALQVVPGDDDDPERQFRSLPGATSIDVLSRHEASEARAGIIHALESPVDGAPSAGVVTARDIRRATLDEADLQALYESIT